MFDLERNRPLVPACFGDAQPVAAMHVFARTLRRAVGSP